MLSIVIPIYNAQATLDRCVASLMRQGLADMQVILVDDGSTDASPQMCDKWAEKDERIEVLHQTNGGLSDARNHGIEHAKGEYITFVDADDFLQDNSYQPLICYLDEHKDCKILEYPVFVHFGHQTEFVLKFQNRTFNLFEDYWIDGEGYRHTYAWNKIYKTELLQKIKYPVGVVFEDIHTLPLFFEKAGAITTIDQGLYFYCHNGNGITATATGKETQMLLDGHLKVLEKYPNLINDDNYYMEILNIQLLLYAQTGANPVIPKHRFSNLKAFQQKSFRWKARINNIFGLKNLCRITKIFH